MRFFIMILSVFLTFFLSLPAYADDDQKEARDALARGDIMPLKDIIDRVEQVLPKNNIIRVKFKRDDGFYIYELKVIDEKGILREVEINAKTGQILEIEVDD